jgi:hypothetical protein
LAYHDAPVRTVSLRHLYFVTVTEVTGAVRHSVVGWCGCFAQRECPSFEQHYLKHVRAPTANCDVWVCVDVCHPGGL